MGHCQQLVTQLMRETTRGDLRQLLGCQAGICHAHNQAACCSGWHYNAIIHGIFIGYSNLITSPPGGDGRRCIVLLAWRCVCLFVSLLCEQVGQINAFLKRIYRCGFSCELIRLETLTLAADKRRFVEMCGQVHRLHFYCQVPVTNFSLIHRPKGHPFELLCYSYDLSRKSFVLKCLYELTSFGFAVFLICLDCCFYFVCSRTFVGCSQ